MRKAEWMDKRGTPDVDEQCQRALGISLALESP